MKKIVNTLSKQIVADAEQFNILNIKRDDKEKSSVTIHHCNRDLAVCNSFQCPEEVFISKNVFEVDVGLVLQRF